MTEVSPQKQLMNARLYLDKLSIFIVNMANFYKGANPTFDQERVMLLPNNNVEEAFAKVELLRKKISALPFKFKDQRVTVTLSCGLCQITQESTLEKAVEKVDSFLFKAKDAGRNQTIFKDI
jgi:uncharacterized protein YlzI (FlbEa/FlbD family)